MDSGPEETPTERKNRLLAKLMDDAMAPKQLVQSQPCPTVADLLKARTESLPGD